MYFSKLNFILLLCFFFFSMPHRSGLQSWVAQSAGRSEEDTLRRTWSLSPTSSPRVKIMFHRVPSPWRPAGKRSSSHQSSLLVWFLLYFIGEQFCHGLNITWQKGCFFLIALLQSTDCVSVCVKLVCSFLFNYFILKINTLCLTQFNWQLKS